MGSILSPVATSLRHHLCVISASSSFAFLTLTRMLLPSFMILPAALFFSLFLFKRLSAARTTVAAFFCALASDNDGSIEWMDDQHQTWVKCQTAFSSFGRDMQLRYQIQQSLVKALGGTVQQVPLLTGLVRLSDSPIWRGICCTLCETKDGIEIERACKNKICIKHWVGIEWMDVVSDRVYVDVSMPQVRSIVSSQFRTWLLACAKLI